RISLPLPSPAEYPAPRPWAHVPTPTTKPTPEHQDSKHSGFDFTAHPCLVAHPPPTPHPRITTPQVPSSLGALLTMTRVLTPRRSEYPDPADTTAATGNHAGP